MICHVNVFAFFPFANLDVVSLYFTDCRAYFLLIHCLYINKDMSAIGDYAYLMALDSIGRSLYSLNSSYG